MQKTSFPLSNQSADSGYASITIKSTTYKAAIRAACFMSSEFSLHNAAQCTACPGLPDHYNS